jgi:3-deoxy-D-manno-octulosonate 8-phosphate phosphatase (KDO 8-P phosphatase)
MNSSVKGDNEFSQVIAHIKWLICDVDGVLTDGGVYLIGPFFEAKRFDIQDGMGITLARKAGLKIGFITGRSSFAVKRRAKELNIDYLSQGEHNKGKAFDVFIKKTQASHREIAYIGDDIQDLPILQRVGVPIAVNNARPEVKSESAYITQATGGHGAVREVVDWILKIRQEIS